MSQSGTALTTADAGVTLPRPREHLQAPATVVALRVQCELLRAARDFLRDEGCVELLPQIIGPVTDPGARGAKQVDIDYYGHRYKVMTSGILYKQTSLLTFDRIFTVAPNVRLEPLETATTHRHLAEFHQLDVELADADRDEALRVAEGVVNHMVGHVLGVLDTELRAIGREPAPLAAAIEGRYDRIGHAEAVRKLRALGHPQPAATEIDWPGEELLSRQLTRPAFLLDYPKGARGFYDREDPARPGVLRNFDLIAPEGYGELCSGGEREHDYAAIVTRMRESGENPAKYAWYLEVAREGLRPSAGFGIGVQRLTRYVCGLAAVWQASGYPKIPGMVSP